MNVKNWIEKNYNELVEISKKVINTEESMEVFQIVMLSMLEKADKLDEMEDNQKKYYMIRALRNQYFSNTSQYHYTQRKHQMRHIQIDGLEFSEKEDEQIKPTLEWVYKKLDTMSWFDRDLFLLWLELGTLTKVAEQTTIPLNSVGKYIRKTKKYLIKEFNKTQL